MGSEGLGIDAQIPLAQSLKEETKSLQIPQQSGGSGLQQGAGQGGVGKVPLLRLLYPHRGPDARGEGRLVVRDEQPLEDVQVGRHGVAVDVLVVHRLDVLHQRLVGDGGALVPGQGAQ